MNPRTEQLIRDYLNRLALAARDRLGPAQRQELLARIGAALEREASEPGEAGPARVRRLVSGLGKPEAVVAQEQARLAGRGQERQHRGPGRLVAQPGHWLARRAIVHGPVAEVPVLPTPEQLSEAPMTGEIRIDKRPISARQRPGKPLADGQQQADPGRTGRPAQQAAAGGSGQRPGRPATASAAGPDVGPSQPPAAPRVIETASQNWNRVLAMLAGKPGKAAPSDRPAAAGRAGPGQPEARSAGSGRAAAGPGVADSSAGGTAAAGRAAAGSAGSGRATSGPAAADPASGGRAGAPAGGSGRVAPGAGVADSAAGGPAAAGRAGSGSAGSGRAAPGPAAAGSAAAGHARSGAVPAGPAQAGQRPAGPAGNGPARNAAVPAGFAQAGQRPAGPAGSGPAGNGPARNAAVPAGSAPAGQRPAGPAGGQAAADRRPGRPGTPRAARQPAGPPAGGAARGGDGGQQPLVDPADLTRQPGRGERLGTVGRNALRTAATTARSNPLEAVALVLLGPGGAAFPPIWLAGAAVAAASRVWDLRDKWISLAGLPPLVIVGTALAIALGGRHGSFSGYAHATLMWAILLSRAGALLDACYLGWRLRQGPRPPASAPFRHPVSQATTQPGRPARPGRP